MEQNNQTREEPVYTFPKNSKEEVRASFSNWQGHDLVDLRVFARQSDGEFVPTRKGLTIARELVPELLKAVESLQRESAA